MNRADILKTEILRQYKSIRQFAMEMKIPYSTLVTALDRGIEGMAYGTVITMCDRLNLNPVDFTPLEDGANLGGKIVENRVMQEYVKLNKTGRKKVLDYMTDLTLLEKYQGT
ncbi:MAG: transcriptional regulator [Lachnospiraceae bacterium]|nr:transcriptional regulator [Butyrivibrio sp.]MBR0172745.1 transcriptional regulator [Lachnospiraceae bacterium]